MKKTFALISTCGFALLAACSDMGGNASSSATNGTQASAAADSGPHTCVLDKLTDTEEKAIGNLAVNDILRNGSSEASDPGVMQPPEKFAQDCAKEHGWSADQTEAGRMYAIASSAAPAIAEELKKLGLDPVKVQALYDSLSPAERATLLTNPDSMSTVLETNASKVGLDIGSESLGTVVGVYLGMIAMKDNSRETLTKK